MEKTDKKQGLGEDLLMEMVHKITEKDNDTIVDTMKFSFEEEFLSSIAKKNNYSSIPKITNIILSRFDEIIGPIIFLAENYNDERSFKYIINLFDVFNVNEEDEFFFETKDIYLLNKGFSIRNDKRRGRGDLLMISFELQHSDLTPDGKQYLKDLIHFFVDLILTEPDFAIFTNENYDGVSEIKLVELINDIENIFDTFIGVITDMRSLCPAT